MSDRRIADFMAREIIDQVLERRSECSGNGQVLGNYTFSSHVKQQLGYVEKVTSSAGYIRPLLRRFRVSLASFTEKRRRGEEEKRRCKGNAEIR
jgi:hypothetical protein